MRPMVENNRDYNFSTVHPIHKTLIVLLQLKPQGIYCLARVRPSGALRRLVSYKTYKNSDATIWEMYNAWWWIIYAHCDISHQAHFTGPWKIRNSCNMCAYQKNIVKFRFSMSMEMDHTPQHGDNNVSWGAIKPPTFFFKSQNSKHVAIHVQITKSCKNVMLWF